VPGSISQDRRRSASLIPVSPSAVASPEIVAARHREFLSDALRSEFFALDSEVAEGLLLNLELQPINQTKPNQTKPNQTEMSGEEANTFDAIEENVAEALQDIELPGVMSVSDADVYWQRMYRRLRLETPEERSKFRVAFALYIMLGSTSTTQNFDEEFRIGGVKYKWRVVMNDKVLPIRLLRQFWRSQDNLAFVEELSTHREVGDRLQAKAKRLGCGTGRGTIDIVEFFSSLTAAERADVARVSTIRRSANNATLQTGAAVVGADHMVAEEAEQRGNGGRGPAPWAELNT